MLYYLRKNPKLLPRDLISRLEALNKYIMYIPAGIQEEGREGNWLTGARSFTQKELVNIVMFMIPRAWLNAMLAADMKPYGMSLPTLKAYLPNFQKTMTSEHKVPNKP